MSKFKVGDKVMVRYWDDMAREHGVDKYGRIKVPMGFLEDMRKLCGKTAKIKKMYDDSGAIELSIRPTWMFSEEMLVLVEAAKEMPASEEKTDDELKACPLCGDRAEESIDKFQIVDGALFAENIICCKACGLMLKRKTEIRCKNGGAEVIHNGFAEAVEAWNRRYRSGV